MAWYSFDREHCTLLVLSDGPSTTDDYEQLCQWYLVLDQAAVEQNKESLSFMIVEGPAPRADASWRKRFAELRLILKAKRRLGVLVTESTILRGVMTVINWIQPKPDNEEQGTFASVDEGIRWVESKGGPSRQSIERLYQEARQQKRKTGGN